MSSNPVEIVFSVRAGFKHGGKTFRLRSTVYADGGGFALRRCSAEIKIYRGIDLAEAQLNPAPETTAAPTTVPAAPAPPSAPATFDVSVLLAAAAALSATGIVIGKKRR